MLTHLGSLTLGQCVPMLATSSAHLQVAIGIGTQASAELAVKISPVIASLNAKLLAAQRLSASLILTPPSLAGQLDAALKMVAALQAAIAIGLPGVSFQLAAVAKLIVSIQADIAALGITIDYDALLGIEVDFAAELSLLLGTPGIHAYAYTGPVRDFGDELEAATSGGFPGGNGGDGCVAVIFAASDGGAVAALEQAFAVAA